MTNIDKKNLVEFCKDLIQIPSQAGKEKSVIKRAQEELHVLGFDECECDDFGSVIGILRGGDGPTVIFDAHMDTVGVEPVKEWTRDPFGGWVEGGRIYGRGSVDMKGSAASIVYGIASLLPLKSEIKGTIIVSLSTLEELCEGIALGNIIDKRGADYVVIGEPSNLRLVRGQRGRAEITITTQGVPAHSSTPHLGVDAVDKMTKLIGKMNEIELPRHEFLGTGIQALTDIISVPYPAQSTVPSRCRVTYDRRLVVGENETSIARELHDLIETARTEDPELRASAEIVTVECTAYTGHKFSFRKFIPAWEIAEDHKLVVAAAGALESIGLRGLPADYYRFCTNGSWPSVHAGIPTIGFGPGHADLAHSTDESVEIEQLEAAARGYASIARAILS